MKKHLGLVVGVAMVAVAGVVVQQSMGGTPLQGSIWGAIYGNSSSDALPLCGVATLACGDARCGSVYSCRNANGTAGTATYACNCSASSFSYPGLSCSGLPLCGAVTDRCGSPRCGTTVDCCTGANAHSTTTVECYCASNGPSQPSTLTNGEPCYNDSECASGFCNGAGGPVPGVCASTASIPPPIMPPPPMVSSADLRNDGDACQEDSECWSGYCNRTSQYGGICAYPVE
jgi:hypothetical protein